MNGQMSLCGLPLKIFFMMISVSSGLVVNADVVIDVAVGAAGDDAAGDDVAFNFETFYLI